jgi:uncharacterized protein with ParB-like and HNH nuclease domain
LSFINCLSIMQKIIGKEKSLSDLLINKKYTIHYYQREYRWGKKQIEDLIDDLEGEFNNFYEPSHQPQMVEKYGHYYLGAIVLSSGNGEGAIIDGQQRLTSITLLLIYLNNIQRDRADKIAIDNLIFSEKHGIKSFNISVAERERCLDALYNRRQDFNLDDEPESVRAIYERYNDIADIFPEDLKGDALPLFIDWLIYNVDLVEISAYTEQDAHKIFVSMNDRGLNLTPTEMLKGFLLSEIQSDQIRERANDIWKQQILELNEIDKDEDANFFKNWLRAQYAESIRATKTGAINEDWDIIGTTFHKWVRENIPKMELNKSLDYEEFVIEYFPKYARIYRSLKNYATHFDSDYECVFYNAERNFTLQYQAILAAIDPKDDEKTIKQKIQLVSRYIDQFIARRVFNFKTVDYSSIKNTIFNLSKLIRHKKVPELVALLQNELSNLEFTLDGVDNFYLNQFTGRYMLHVLARMTYFVERGSGLPTKFEDLVDRKRRIPSDIEHILPNRFDLYQPFFATEEVFQSARNRFGVLIILPQDINRSLKDKKYSEKLQKYREQNLLARSLHETCYTNNPQFLKFIDKANLPFEPIPDFTESSIEKRQKLYKAICREIWDPHLFDYEFYEN